MLELVAIAVFQRQRAEEVAALVAQRERARATEEQEELEEQIEWRVSEALGLTVAGQEAIALWAAANPNWRLRERVRKPALKG